MVQNITKVICTLWYVLKSKNMEVRGNTGLSFCLATKATAKMEDWECKPVGGPYIERCENWHFCHDGFNYPTE